jgi:hypothetical protein
MTPTCCKILAFLFLFCWIWTPQCLADIVPVSVSQQMSVSGSVTACDDGCQMLFVIQHDGQSFSSANANTNLPTTNVSQDGGVVDTVSLPFDPPVIRGASDDASASQTSALSSANFNLALYESGDLSGVGFLQSGAVAANSQYSLIFNLTNVYVVHLTGDISSGSDGDYPGNSFDGEIHLTGPGLQFDQAPLFPTEGYADNSFDEVLTLGPGQYALDAVSGFNVQQFDNINSNSFSSVYLNADFTPAVPEPARVSTVLEALIVAGLFFARWLRQNR